MDYFTLTKIKEYVADTPLAFQHHISQNASKLFTGIESEPLPVDLLEAQIFQIVVDHYKYFKIATDFTESLESNDHHRMASVINHLHTLPGISERNQDIIRLRLIDNLTFEKTGNTYNISRERVRQIIYRSLDKILDHIGRGGDNETFEKYAEMIRVQSRKDN